MSTLGNKRLAVMILCIAVIMVKEGSCSDDPFYGGRNGVLPKNVKPVEYNIDLTFDFDATKLTGKVDMHLEIGEVEPRTPPKQSKVKKLLGKKQKDERGGLEWVRDELSRTNPGDFVAFNIAKQFEIKKVSLKVAETSEQLRAGQGKEMDVVDVWRASSAPAAAIFLGQDLPTNSFVMLSVEYESTHRIGKNLQLESGSIDGVVYYSSDIDLSGRGLFPCMDDPNHRVKVSLAINQNDASKQVVSNMPGKVVPQDGSKFSRTEFETITDPIAVNKLAFAIGSFDEPLVAEASNGHKVQIIAPKGYREQTHAALDFAQRSLVWLQKYTGVDLPIKTVSIVGSPSVRFLSPAGGPGISLIHHPSLVLQEAKEGHWFKTVLAVKMAMAMARQWFGGIRTESSYTTVWATEAFAAHLAIRIVREQEPELKVDQYMREVLVKASLKADREIMVSQDVRYGIDENRKHRFNMVRLVKGAAIVQVLERIVVDDETKFDDIVRSLATKPGVMTVALIGEAFENDKFNREQIYRMLLNWTSAGYPLIRVSCSEKVYGLKIVQKDPEGTYTYSRDAYCPLKLKIFFASQDGTKTDTREVLMFGDKDDYAQSIDLKVPDWFRFDKYDWFMFYEDEQALRYYQLAFDYRVAGNTNLAKKYLGDNLFVEFEVSGWAPSAGYDVCQRPSH